MNLTMKRILSYVPTRLPVGLTEFEAWSQDIVDLTNFADPDSLRFAIASMVIHLPANTGLISKNHFVRGLRKSAANQVASQVFQDVKLKQQKLAEAAAELAKAAECPTPQSTTN